MSLTDHHSQTIQGANPSVENQQLVTSAWRTAACTHLLQAAGGLLNAANIQQLQRPLCHKLGQHC